MHEKQNYVIALYINEWGNTLFHSGATTVGAPIAYMPPKLATAAQRCLSLGNFGLFQTELELQIKEADNIPFFTGVSCVA